MFASDKGVLPREPEIPVFTEVKKLPPPPKTGTVDPLLVKILSWKRPHDSTSEMHFCDWICEQIGKRGQIASRMAGGCITATVCAEGTEPLPSTLFSCHVDTVHHVGGPKQSIVYDPSFGHIFLDKADPNAGSCLGADDGAGVWLMLQMIEAKVPGTYVFHRGEERGAIGARAMLQKHSVWLSTFDAAVAFDRPDTYEIITHQGGQRCASDKYATKLAKLLNEHGLAYELSSRGVFTDTKVYRDVIPECLNIGVGYHHQHGQDEYLDYEHLLALRDAVIAINWESLPVDRDPSKSEWEQYGTGARWGGYGGHGGYGGYSGYTPPSPRPSPGPYKPTVVQPTGGAGVQGRFPGFTGPWPGREEFDDIDLEDIPPSSAEPPSASGPGVPEEAGSLEGLTVKEPTLVEELESASIEEIQAAVEALGEDAAYMIAELVSKIKGLQAELAQLKEYMRR